MRRAKPEIEDVAEAFCGVRRRNLIPLSDYDPEVAFEWCYSKNCGWGPDDFSHASSVRAWWICPKCKREYKASVNNRVSNKSGCPFCASKKVCEDNSLAILYPEIAKEWHPKLNTKLKVEEVTYASAKIVWWRCGKCRHAWQAGVADRTTLESGCPACYKARMEYARLHPPPRKRGHVVLGGSNEDVSRSWYEAARKEFIPLGTSHPDIAKLWHPTANGKWTPADFAYGSEAIAWWKCPNGPDHEWQGPISARTDGRNSKCPFCTGRRASASNSLASLFPNIAQEWHPTLNGALKPTEVTAHSKQKVFWKCKVKSEHVWRTTIYLRTKGTNCPFCSRFRVSKDTSLKALFPEIAAQLHPTKNKLCANEIAPFSGKLVWWKCAKARDHEWQATPANRTANQSGCPCCVGRKPSVTNSLASVFPKIAGDWHKVKNGGFKPSDYSYGSSKLAWWVCRSGHVWQQIIEKRTSRQSGCPRCKQKGIHSLDTPRTKVVKSTKRASFDS